MYLNPFSLNGDIFLAVYRDSDGWWFPLLEPKLAFILGEESRSPLLKN